MNNMMRYGLIAAVVAGIFLYTQTDKTGSGSSSDNSVASEIDMKRVLEITEDSIQSYQETLETTSETDTADADAALTGLADELQTKLNTAMPELYSSTLGVAAQEDASLLGFADSNSDGSYSSNEEALFKIEVDAENGRLISSSRSGEVTERGFSGTGLLAGFLIGSMMNRQRAAGVNTSQLANKKPVSAAAAQANARSRAGSGSHSRGK